MDFYINDEKIDITLEEEKTVGDVLKSFEITCEENETAVIGIKINGTQITAESFDGYAEKELDDSMKFEFSIVTKQNIKDAFKNLAELFTKLSEKMQTISVELQSGKAKEANESILTLADSINEFCHVATLATLFQDYTEVKIEDKPFSEFFKDFSPVLSDFESALKNNDTVSVGDLAEYEICPRLISIAKALEGLA